MDKVMYKLVEIVLSKKAQKVYLFLIACYFVGYVMGSFIGNIVK